MKPYAIHLADENYKIELWICAKNPDDALRFLGSETSLHQQVQEVIDLSDPIQAQKALIPDSVIHKASPELKTTTSFLLENASVTKVKATITKPKRSRGRPKGAANKPKPISATAVIERSCRTAAYTQVR